MAVSSLVAGVGGLGFISVLAAEAMGKQGLSAPLWAGYCAALALAIPSYLSLAWSLQQPNKVFYGVFFGGMFFRLSGLAVTAFVVYRFYRLALAAVVLSLVFGLIFSSFIEMYFIQKETRA